VVMLLTNANGFLSDPNQRLAFEPDFGRTGGAAITAIHDALCEAAATYGATCIDLRSVLNGPDLATPPEREHPRCDATSRRRGRRSGSR
jgi:hypothetical protein